jgi:N-acetylmuramoyl-L-alanine amidase
VLVGHRTAITVEIRPREAGRLVLLRRVHNGHYINFAFATTNSLGVATYRRTFNTPGSQRLRATLIATGALPSALSNAVVEHVDTLLPMVLPAGAQLTSGMTSDLVTQLQERLTGLGYWMGTPDGYFGDATVQAVYALQKAAGLNPTGIVDQATVAALNAGTLPTPRTTSGNAIDVDLEDDLVMFVQNGQLRYVLNTSTGGGYTYVEDGVSSVATTPSGVFSINRTVDGTVVDSLGTLWRPRFFYEGFAIHGDSYVPSVPASHGCVRISDEAIDWVWAQNLAPIGMEVWVY